MSDEDTGEVVQESLAPEKDWLLELMTSFANSGVGQSIVLFVGGSIISGELISGQDYLERMARMAENTPINGPAGSEVITRNLAAGFRQFKSMYDKPDDAGEDWVAPKPGYIHLKNARLYTSNGTIPNTGSFLWRGRIGNVDAWAPGGMTS